MGRVEQFVPIMGFRPDNGTGHRLLFLHSIHFSCNDLRGKTIRCAYPATFGMYYQTSRDWFEDGGASGGTGVSCQDDYIALFTTRSNFVKFSRVGV